MVTAMRLNAKKHIVKNNLKTVKKGANNELLFLQNNDHFNVF